MQFSTIQGAIFDVDDTLLNNYPEGSRWNIHEYSRLQAAQEVGKRHAIPKLQIFTLEECTTAFLNAQTHTLQGATWEMLRMAGVVDSQEVDPTHPLLHEIMQLKDVLHEEILRKKGREVPGATAFVHKLAALGLGERLSIASTSYRRDIDIFLEMVQLEELFPDAVIISRERFTNPKPHPEAFNRAFDTLKLPAIARQQVIAFEDDPRGIASAKRAGLYTCAITTRYSRAALEALPVPPDLIAASFAEFEALLRLP